MRGSRQILIAALLLAPVLSLVTASGGLPFCCWTSKHCPMTMNMPASMPGMPDCHMVRICSMPAAPPLILPAPALPIFPIAAPSVAVPMANPARPPAAAPVRTYRGWPLSVFHPPQI